MKKFVFLVVFSSTLTVNADLLNFFDFTKFGEAALLIADGINDNLEKVRLVQHEKLPIGQQWAVACETTQNLNRTVYAFKAFLDYYNFDQKTCLPVANVLKLQIEIIKNCQNFYNKSVPVNSEVMLSQFVETIVQSKMIITKCYPTLGN